MRRLYLPCCANTGILQVQRQVRQQVGRHVDAVGGVGLGGARVAQAQADAQFSPASGPCTSLYLPHTLAMVSGMPTGRLPTSLTLLLLLTSRRFHVTLGDATLKLRVRLASASSSTMRFDFARLQTVQRIVRIQGLHVFLAQVKHGCREKSRRNRAAGISRPLPPACPWWGRRICHRNRCQHEV